MGAPMDIDAPEELEEVLIFLNGAHSAVCYYRL